MILKFRQTFIGFVFCFGVLLGGTGVRAQDSIFTYQGKLTDNNQAANGNYTMRFELFSAAAGGTQIGSPYEIAAVQVVNGIFTVNLDFDHTAFDGFARFLQITILSGNTPTALTPRQRITAAPYAIKSSNAEAAKNALSLGGFAAELYAKKDDARFTDQRSPLSGSNNYIQNSINSQIGSSFNITGTGTVGGTLSGNLINSETQYNLDERRVLGVAGDDNIFVGINAGKFNTTGTGNSFVGQNAGLNNIAGDENALFGFGAGVNTKGNQNSFSGAYAGANNTTGSKNTSIGWGAGSGNVTGANNTAVGYNANFGTSNLSFATAIGAGASVSTSNTIVLGRDSDKVRVPGLGAGGYTALCRNGLNEISTCTAGNFAEKDASRIAAGFDALNEQNAQMRDQLIQQRILIDELKEMLCQNNPQAKLCVRGEIK